MYFYNLILVVFFCSFTFSPLFALSIEEIGSLEVVINEIAWMGTKESHTDEWIELYNNSNKDISIDGWKITSQDKTPLINLKGTIKSKSFFLLERTNDQTLPTIKADLIYRGSLNNKGEHLKLVTNQEVIVDEIDCLSYGIWFAGNNEKKQTMERKDGLQSGNDFKNWQSSKEAEGTPKNKNSDGFQIETTSTNKTEEKESNFSYSFLMFSFFMSIFSAITILILKKLLYKTKQKM